jgi:hypothetical protein
MQRPVLELGLVLNGPVGAYSAGVLDFLQEALAAYEAEQASLAPDLPPLDVKLRLAAGGSDTLLGNRAALFSHFVEERDLARFGPAALREIAARQPHPVRTGGEAGLTIVIDEAERDAPAEAARPQGLAGLLLRLAAPHAPALSPAPGRFVIAPGPGLLAGGGLGGLTGLIDRRLRLHDFLLGRRNAQRFLARHLALPASHPAVAQWTEAMDRAYGIWPKGVAQRLPAPLRPLLPLTGRARTPCEPPAWPRLEAKILRGYQRLVRRQVAALLREFGRAELGGLARLALELERGRTARAIAAHATGLLAARGRIPPCRPDPESAAAPDRPSRRLWPLPEKRRKILQSAGWGHSIDGRDGPLQPVSIRAEAP